MRGLISIFQLITDAQRGDDCTFLKLFQQHEEDIYRMAFIYVKNQEDALDVVQEVAYRAFKNIKTLQKPEFFKTWLMKITMNTAINLLKKNNKTVSLDQELIEKITEENEDLPLTLTLHDLIENLLTEEKSVVLLRFYKNYTFKEIAELLDIPLSTAKSVLYRALHKLRNEYEKGMV